VSEDGHPMVEGDRDSGFRSGEEKPCARCAANPEVMRGTVAGGKTVVAVHVNGGGRFHGGDEHGLSLRQFLFSFLPIPSFDG